VEIIKIRSATKPRFRQYISGMVRAVSGIVGRYDVVSGAVYNPYTSRHRAVVSVKILVRHCVSHVTPRPRDCDVVFPVNRISGQRQYMLIGMLMLASTRNLDIWV